ncbi:MAG: N-acetyl-gamma-glutamyl-phosphate reductase [Bacteroidia bacterium]
MITAGIIGGAGYTGGEVFRLLLNHPDAEIAFVQSDSQAGKKVYDVHHDCFGASELVFTKGMGDADVIFLCKGHGESKVFLEKNPVPANTKIIDMSSDFRHTANNRFHARKFVYGLPELNRNKLQTADAVANPGCFATCIQLGLLPLAAKGIISPDVHVTATTGSTGAGQALSDSSHFSWRDSNLSAYKLFEHQHETEIQESLNSLKPFNGHIYFIPQRGAFTRGIYAVTYLQSELSTGQANELYSDYYVSHPFTHVVPFEIDLKQVANTNNCFISVKKTKDRLVIISAIDNLLKGAAGQAVQNMNLLFSIKETTGLTLKPSVF